jgi:hypothetical protein
MAAATTPKSSTRWAAARRARPTSTAKSTASTGTSTVDLADVDVDVYSANTEFRFHTELTQPDGDKNLSTTGYFA